MVREGVLAVFFKKDYGKVVVAGPGNLVDCDNGCCRLGFIKFDMSV